MDKNQNPFIIVARKALYYALSSIFSFDLCAEIGVVLFYFFSF